MNMLENLQSSSHEGTSGVSDGEEISKSDSKTKFEIKDAITILLPTLRSFQPDILKHVEADENSPLLGNDLDVENGLFRRWVKPFRKKDTKT